jgi:surfeit locus 1 family protein
MQRRFLRPGWLFAHIVVAALAILFVGLGLWQLDRLDERRAENAVGEDRFFDSPVTLAAAEAKTIDFLEFRRVLVEGEFDVSSEVLVRSQVHRGNAGFHVITPLVVDQGEGEAVLVNRGWVPLLVDDVPVEEAPPPSGKIRVEGWGHATQERPPLGPEDPPEGRLERMNRVDVERIELQVPYTLSSFYLVELREQGSGLPVPIDEPVFDNEGPHLAYAIQWFGFVLVLIVGWVFLVRRQMRTSSQERSGARASPSTISKPSSPSN